MLDVYIWFWHKLLKEKKNGRKLVEEFNSFDYKSVLRDEDLKEKLLGIKSKYKVLNPG